MISLSRLSNKGQVTIPKAVRERLGIAPGDTVVYEMRDGQVVLRGLGGDDRTHYRILERTLGEWASADDDEAYRDL